MDAFALSHRRQNFDNRVKFNFIKALFSKTLIS